MHEHKLTSYLIAVEDPLNLERWILYPTRSEIPTTISVSKEIFDHLKTGAFHIFKTEILELFIKHKLLVPIEEIELNAIVSENRNATLDSTRLDITLMPSAACPHGCNLSQYGAYCGQEHSKTLWNTSQTDRILKQINQKLALGHYTTLQVDFFGAEPLTNFNQVIYALTKVKEISSQYGVRLNSDITTSGLLLSLDRAQQLFDAGLTDFEVTLDGPSKHHDTRRCTKGGQPTFQIIYDNLLQIAKSSTLIDLRGTIRMNVDIRNQSSSLPFFQQLVNDNLIPRFNFYISPIRDIGVANAGSKYTKRSPIQKIEIDLLKESVAAGLTPNILPERRKTLCPAVDDHASIFDPYGALHQCTETPLVQIEKLPRSYSTHTSWRPAWESLIQHEQVPCSSCNLFPVCGGGCPKDWALDKPPCPLFKDNIEERIILSSHTNNHYEILL